MTIKLLLLHTDTVMENNTLTVTVMLNLGMYQISRSIQFLFRLLTVKNMDNETDQFYLLIKYSTVMNGVS